MPDLSLDATFSVPYRYPVHFTRDLFSSGNELLRRCMPGAAAAMVFLDAGLAAVRPDLTAEIAAWAERSGVRLGVPVEVVEGGERLKDGLAPVEGLIATLQRAALCRHSYVLAIGGGALLDAVGLAAALVHRGMRLIRCPSTALAQGDSAVGVKNGVNLRGEKNFLGTFAPPWAVLADLSLLASLPHSLLLDGVAEAIKVALIKDARLFRRLAEEAAAIGAGALPPIEAAIVASARLHLEHIATSGDPFELGSARPLDFGHWAAHRLESLSAHALRHGEAVAIGIALDTCYAESQGWLSANEAEQILGTLGRMGLPLWHPLLAEGERLFSGLEDFRRHLGGELTITFPRGIGGRIEVNRIDSGAMRTALSTLRAVKERLHAPGIAS